MPDERWICGESGGEVCCLCAIRIRRQELVDPERGSGNGCKEGAPNVHERLDVSGVSVLRTKTWTALRDDFGEGGVKAEKEGVIQD